MKKHKRIKMKKRYIKALALCIFSTYIIMHYGMDDSHQAQQPTPSSSIAPQENKKIINVLIHGTRLMPESFEGNLLYTGKGLIPMNTIKDTYIEKKAANILNKIDPKEYPLDHFYFFGWSGQVSFDDRAKGGEQLYEALKKIVNDTPSTTPVKIRVITLSHGGNVATSMAKPYHEDTSATKKPTIDELVLLCSPVMVSTQINASSPLFKKIFHIYSHMDPVQVADPLFAQSSSNPNKEDDGYLPDRIFDAKKHPALKGKLKQANTFFSQGTKHLGIGHTEFAFPFFMKKLPGVIKTMDAHESHEPMQISIDTSLTALGYDVAGLLKDAINNIYDAIKTKFTSTDGTT